MALFKSTSLENGLSGAPTQASEEKEGDRQLILVSLREFDRTGLQLSIKPANWIYLHSTSAVGTAAASEVPKCC